MLSSEILTEVKNSHPQQMYSSLSLQTILRTDMKWAEDNEGTGLELSAY